MKRLLSSAVVLALVWPHALVAAGSVTARDMVAGIGGQVHVAGFAVNTPGSLRVQTPSGATFSVPLTTNVRGDAEVDMPGQNLTEAGRYSLALTLNGVSQSVAMLNVLPDRVDASRSSLSADRRTLSPDGRDVVVITATLTDKFGNPLSSRPVQLIPSRNTVEIRAQANVTDAKGSMPFTLRTSKAGAVTVRAFDLLSATTLDATVTLSASDGLTGVGGYNDDGTLPGQPSAMPNYGYPMVPYPYPNYGYPMMTNPYGAQLIPGAFAQDNFDVISGFRLELTPSKPATNDALTLKIRAVDRLGNTVQSYKNRVRITSTDATATLPGSGVSETGDGEYTFQDRDRGEATLPLSTIFRRGGTQSIFVDDLTGATPIHGELTVSVAGPDVIPAANLIAVITPAKNGFVRATSFNVEGTGPKFTNFTVKILGGTSPEFKGESDQDGKFSIPVSITDGQASYILRVQSIPNGKYDSGDVPFMLKSTPPKIDSIVFTPEKPEEGKNVLAEVLTEPNAKVTVKFSGQETPMVENAGKPGSYQVAFTAPAPGTYQPLFSAEDRAGNVTQQRANLKVVPKGLPEVKNLKAEPRTNSVSLAWDAVPGAASYMVYVGQSAEDLIAIPTDQATTSALIKDLEAGKLYYFAVTGVNGERESPQGQFVTAKPIGVNLEVTPEQSALHLVWILPEEAVELSAFVLEYGVDAQKLTERRLINGALRDYVIRDLLPDVTYYVRLTPVTVTGEVIQDLAMQGKGTVLPFEGFNPTPGEDIGINVDELPPPNEYHEGAPNVTEVGVPRSFVYGALGLAVLGTFVLMRRRRSTQTAEFLKAMDRRYHS